MSVNPSRISTSTGLQSISGVQQTQTTTSTDGRIKLRVPDRPPPPIPSQNMSSSLQAKPRVVAPTGENNTAKLTALKLRVPDRPPPPIPSQNMSSNLQAKLEVVTSTAGNNTAKLNELKAKFNDVSTEYEKVSKQAPSKGKFLSFLGKVVSFITFGRASLGKTLTESSKKLHTQMDRLEAQASQLKQSLAKPHLNPKEVKNLQGKVETLFNELKELNEALENGLESTYTYENARAEGNMAGQAPMSKELAKKIKDTEKAIKRTPDESKLSKQEKEKLSELQSKANALELCQKCLNSQERTIHLSQFEQRLENCSNYDKQVKLIQHMRTNENLRVKAKHSPELVKAELKIIEQKLENCTDPDQKLFLTKLVVAYNVNLSNNPLDQINLIRQLVISDQNHYKGAAQEFSAAVARSETLLKTATIETKADAQKIVDTIKQEIAPHAKNLFEEIRACETTILIANNLLPLGEGSAELEDISIEKHTNFSAVLMQEISRIPMPAGEMLKNWTAFSEEGAPLDKQAAKLQTLVFAGVEFKKVQHDYTENFPQLYDIVGTVSKALNPNLSKEDIIKLNKSNLMTNTIYSKLHTNLNKLEQQATTEEERSSWRNLHAEVSAMEARSKERLDKEMELTPAFVAFAKQAKSLAATAA